MGFRSSGLVKLSSGPAQVPVHVNDLYTMNDHRGSVAVSGKTDHDHNCVGRIEERTGKG